MFLPVSALYEEHGISSGGVGTLGPVVCQHAFKRSDIGEDSLLVMDSSSLRNDSYLH